MRTLHSLDLSPVRRQERELQSTAQLTNVSESKHIESIISRATLPQREQG